VAGDLLTIERVAALRRVPLFAAVPGHTLVAVARVLDEEHVEPGTVVIERGALEDWMFIVVAGRLRVHIGERTIVERGPGDVVGELAVVAPAPRTATVTAITASHLLRLRREPFEELIDDRPDIARGVIASLARLLQADAGIDLTVGS
jgi:CRP-like cAMP-binding protein